MKKFKSSSHKIKTKKSIAVKASGKIPVKGNAKSRATLQSWLQLAQLRCEKCELKEAQVAYKMALAQAKKMGDLRSIMEALSGLLRLAGEALDEVATEQWDVELDRLMAAHPKQIPPMAWYCKGAVARYRGEYTLAQRYFHRYLRLVKSHSKNIFSGHVMPNEEAICRGWINLSMTLSLRGRVNRALWLTQEVLRRYEDLKIRGMNGIIYLHLGTIFERKRDYANAMKWFQKAHASFLEDHNWYYHLYVLFGYARLSRIEQNYVQAYWYLDLVDKATGGSEFGLLKREITAERGRLQQDAVDLLIDSRQGLIKTRENGEITLRKQYVLLHILEALSQAHSRPGDDIERGLSKAEIIESVWKEDYRPEAHDNKLYYNINRLRKLIEPDIQKPQYLLNWKEGYRLAPGLRVHFVGGASKNGLGEKTK